MHRFFFRPSGQFSLILLYIYAAYSSASLLGCNGMQARVSAHAEALKSLGGFSDSAKGLVRLTLCVCYYTYYTGYIPLLLLYAPATGC